VTDRTAHFCPLRLLLQLWNEIEAAMGLDHSRGRGSVPSRPHRASQNPTTEASKQNQTSLRWRTIKPPNYVIIIQLVHGIVHY